jgi:uncharacterized protein
LLGSVLREDFGPERDLDVLVAFESDIPWCLFGWIDMIEELKDIFGRDVDLVEKTGLRNPFRRRSILSNQKVIYST